MNTRFPRMSSSRNTICWLPLLSLAFVTGNAAAADWFVTPEGTPDGAGSSESPWDLETALTADDRVGPGDTVWIAPGSYRHPDRGHNARGFGFSLSGSPQEPVIIRNADGGRVTLDGGLQTSADPVPRHVRIMGLEILASENLVEGELLVACREDG